MLTCDVMACPALTVANSDSTAIECNTLATRLVSCDDGYTSDAGTTFPLVRALLRACLRGAVCARATWWLVLL